MKRLYNENNVKDIADKIRDRKGYEGYNKLQPANKSSAIRGGIEFISNGIGKYTVKGTAISDVQENFKVPNYTIKDGDYIQLKNNEATGTFVILNETGASQILNKAIKSKDFIIDLTEKVGSTIGYIRIFCTTGKTYDLEINPMILNSSSSKPFEPYCQYKLREMPKAIQELPSVEECEKLKSYIPTTTSENGICENAIPLNAEVEVDGNVRQNSYSGKNLINLDTEAITGNNADYLKLNTGYRITLTGTSYSYKTFLLKDVSGDVGKTIRMKSNFNKSNSELNPKYDLLLTASNGKDSVAIESTTSSGKTIVGTIDGITETRKYLSIRFYATVDKIGNIGDYVDFEDIIVTIDNEDMTYEPYVRRTTFTFSRLSTRYRSS